MKIMQNTLSMKKHLGLLGLWAWCLFAHATPPGITTAEFHLSTELPDVKIYVRNKHLDTQTQFTPDKVVLFVHGATYPAETAFDIDLPGGSWMDVAAQAGYDAYLMDVRGYGLSTRPLAMSQPPSANPPFATTEEAIRDIGTVVDFIKQRRGVAKINLVGWSWGTTTTAGYTTYHNDNIHKLVLYAPIWLRRTPSPVTGSGAYRSVTKASARQRGIRGIPQALVEQISPSAWFDQWWELNMQSDQEGAKQQPAVVRAPNGVIQDQVDYWLKEKPTYDPAQIKVPVLLILAEWDQDTPLYMAQELFTHIVNSPEKKHVVLAEGTHSVILEKNRTRLIKEVQHFLEGN